jgi:hypothetical protein
VFSGSLWLESFSKNKLPPAIDRQRHGVIARQIGLFKLENRYLRAATPASFSALMPVS